MLQISQGRYEGEGWFTADALSPRVLSRTTYGVMVSLEGQRTRSWSGPWCLQIPGMYTPASHIPKGLLPYPMQSAGVDTAVLYHDLNVSRSCLFLFCLSFGCLLHERGGFLRTEEADPQQIIPAPLSGAAPGTRRHLSNLFSE